MLERWNPTVKAFTVLICVILLSFEYLVSLNLLVLAVCLLLLMFCSRVSLKKIGVILLPACIAAFGLFVMGLYYARGGSTQTMDLSSLSAMPYSVRAAMSQNLYTALQLATRLLAYAGLGILFALVCKTFATGARSEDMLGSFICAGIGGALMAQIAVNVGMNLRVLPVIGVTLPFYSAGGSSVLMLYICVGLVLSVYMHNTKKLFG